MVKNLLLVLFSLAIGLFGVRVERVVDGDTIKLSNGKVVRYIGIDAPETDECFAKEATAINSELVEGRKVRVETDTNDTDRFGRMLAYVWVDGKMVNEELLQRGAGEYFLDTVNLKHQERLVKAAEVGYGAGGQWKECGPCLVKGNIDRLDKRYYHLPWFRHYGSVEVNLDQGDRWFCSEQEAIGAGFTRARE